MNWFQSRWQPYKELMMTENAVAVFWFIRREAASEFMDSSHNNRFREPCFPTPSGYEAFYVPLLITPPISRNILSVVDKILDQSKLKEIVDNNLNVSQKLKFKLGRVENIVGIGENAGYQHFLLFSLPEHNMLRVSYCDG